jgi:hypothetical protein
MMETRVALTKHQYTELRAHLFPGDGLEAVALLICGRGRGTRREQRLGRRLIPVPPERLLRREHDFVEWPVDEFLLPLVEEMEREDLGVLVVHCHPEGGRYFSSADDDGDRSLFPSIHSWFDRQGAHGAAVMMPNGEIIGRFVGPDGSFRLVDTVSIPGDDIHLFHALAAEPEIPEHARRLVQTFGHGTYQRLKRLKIAVVGCSGTGSVVIELLARNCVGKLVLVDDDRMEAKNLNRIVNSTSAQAAAGRFKVESLREAVLGFGLGVQVEVYSSMLEGDALAAVSECDVVFGCMDKLMGRHVLNSLCSAYCLPLFDVGVEIEADGMGGISQAVADAHYIQPGGSSLMGRGVYTPETLTAEVWERTDPEFYERQKVAGYLASVGEDRPAVMPLNMMASNGAVIDLLARLHGFRLDPNSDFARQRWSITHGYYEHGDDGPACPYMGNLVGLGDGWRPEC